MKLIGGWIAAVLMGIGGGVGVVAAVWQPNGTTTCNSPSACVAIATSSPPSRRLGVPVVPGTSFGDGAVTVGDGVVLFGDNGAGALPGWDLQMDFFGPSGQESLWFSASAASDQYADLAAWRSCQEVSERVGCLLIDGFPAYYQVSPAYVWLRGLHDGVFVLIEAPRPTSLAAGDLGSSPTRAWLVSVMASVYRLSA